MRQTMAAIPAGTATLADRRTERSWEVVVEPFLLATTPVTASEYTAITGRRADGGSGATPAVNLSWWDALGYCNLLSEREELRPAYRIEGEEVEWDWAADGYRLPSEGEWDFACHAGTDGPRYGDLNEIAWYRDNSKEQLHPIGEKRPNAWGLHDMLGNVWEWCFDLYDPEVYGDYRVIKGGGWFDAHWSCRVGVRRRTMPTLRIDDLGFRLARSAVGAGLRGRDRRGAG